LNYSAGGVARDSHQDARAGLCNSAGKTKEQKKGA